MFELYHVINVGVTVRATLSQHKEDLCCKVRALVTFMFVFLCCKVQGLVKSVQGCSLLLEVIGTEPMPVAKLLLWFSA